MKVCSIFNAIFGKNKPLEKIFLDMREVQIYEGMTGDLIL
jgi:hypothetical protein